MAADAEKLGAQAQRIRDLRALARVSQETAAHSVGVSTRAYREWEAGRSDIAPENLKALARYFGTTQDFIEYGTMRRVHAPDPFTDEESQLDRIERALAEINVKLDALTARLGDPGDGSVIDVITQMLEQAAEQQQAAQSKRQRQSAREPRAQAAGPRRAA